MASLDIENTSNTLITNLPIRPRAMSFTLFRMLPAELRIQIWEYALDEAYMVDLPPAGIRGVVFPSMDGYPTFIHMGYCVLSQVPQLFYVSHESRQITLERRTRCKPVERRWFFTSPSGSDIVIDIFGLHNSGLCANGDPRSLRTFVFFDRLSLRDRLADIHRLRSNRDTKKYRLSTATFRQGHHQGMVRRVTRLDTLIRELESQIELDIESCVRDCLRLRQKYHLDKVERWILLLKDRHNDTELQYSNLVFIDRSEVAPNFWQRQEDNKNSEDPKARAMAMEAEKLEIAKD
ncbi:hypothetical protein F4820DRAFT_468129 [Hypoxylon rubiginosum]|uniref:Uncharacterized protein n=1 Tax=Hypoxylon rubiginosum TaxID=110542 RepID=A0ACB9ZFN7_9PEZI|nr:hypothetical protein F4820DRAFT_468129 [Hypoxylon rubiginosum]